jgi:hypothetical protein
VAARKDGLWDLVVDAQVKARAWRDVIATLEAAPPFPNAGPGPEAWAGVVLMDTRGDEAALLRLCGLVERCPFDAVCVQALQRFRAAAALQPPGDGGGGGNDALRARLDSLAQRLLV